MPEPKDMDAIQMVKCPECNGEGRYYDASHGSRHCTDCRGTGEIEKPAPKNKTVSGRLPDGPNTANYARSIPESVEGGARSVISGIADLYVDSAKAALEGAARDAYHHGAETMRAAILQAVQAWYARGVVQWSSLENAISKVKLRE